MEFKMAKRNGEHVGQPHTVTISQAKQPSPEHAEEGRGHSEGPRPLSNEVWAV